MNEFENKLIMKEEAYDMGFFPKIPKFGKLGSAFILAGGSGNDIVVNELTTSKEIRQGKYTKLIEISILPYMKEIRFHSPSKEIAYSFDVYVKAVIQVNDPILFYQNKNIDVDAYIDNLFSMDVRKVTKRYSILSYDDMDEELTQKLSSYNTIDPMTGFRYQISTVNITPGEKAAEYVEQFSKQQLDAGMKRNARELISSYTVKYDDAIMAEVVEGKMSETEAIKRIEEYRNMTYDNQLKRVGDLRDKGLITDKGAKEFISTTLECVNAEIKPEGLKGKIAKNSKIDELYFGEDE